MLPFFQTIAPLLPPRQRAASGLQPAISTGSALARFMGAARRPAAPRDLSSDLVGVCARSAGARACCFDFNCLSNLHLRIAFAKRLATPGVGPSPTSAQASPAGLGRHGGRVAQSHWQSGLPAAAAVIVLTLCATALTGAR